MLEVGHVRPAETAGPAGPAGPAASTAPARFEDQCSLDFLDHPVPLSKGFNTEASSDCFEDGLD